MQSETRLPHAVLNLQTRNLKAKKIEQIINPFLSSERINILEIGTGSGGIAAYFAGLSYRQWDVQAVDVVDSRLVKEGFRFQLVEGTDLPFVNDTFDVVISNHVIEHVGDYEAQIAHLNELKRVLKKDGVAYLAVPNRWMLVEPHYRLIFLSWLPKRLRTPYLKLLNRGNYYDCEPLEKGEIESMLRRVNLTFTNECVKAMRLTFEIESPNSLTAKLLKLFPNRLLGFFNAVIPTLIYTIRKPK